MLAGIFEREGVLTVKNVNEPQLKFPDDVKIKVEVAGLCGTDVHIIASPQVHPGVEGIILGHEFVGKVVEIGSEIKELKIGDRVIAGPNIWCGQCEECLKGNRKLCRNNRAMGITIDGGFADFVVAPAKALYPISSTLTPEQAIFAEPLSCIVNGFNKLGNVFGLDILILGSGPIGLYFVQLFKNFAAKNVTVVEPDDKRRKFASECGADFSVSTSSQIPNYKSVDIVVDTTGFLMNESLEFTKPGGKTLLFGLDQTCECNIKPFDIVRYEKKVIGCFIDNDLIPLCLDLIPKLDLGKLISHRFLLKDLNEAINIVKNGNCIKTLVYPGESLP